MDVRGDHRPRRRPRRIPRGASVVRENLIVGFARIEGMVVGLIANQPAVRAGALDMDAADKGARFIRFCKLLQHPARHPRRRPRLPARHRAGARRASSAMAQSSCSPTPPARRPGDGDPAQGLRRLLPRHVQPGDGRRFRVRLADRRDRGDGADGAVRVLYGKEIKAAADPKAKAASSRPPTGRSSPRPTWRRARATSPTSSIPRSPARRSRCRCARRCRSARSGRPRSTATSPLSRGRSREVR